MSVAKRRKEIEQDIAETIDYKDSSVPLRLRQEEYLLQNGYSFRYNTVRLNLQYRIDKGDWMDIDQRFEAKLQREYELSKVFVGREIPSSKRIEAIMTAPNISQDYDPFRTFFETNKWDGRDRITDLMQTVKPINHQFKGFTAQWAWEKYFKRWLVCSVRCMLGEGANHVMMLFIAAKQGVYKTTWLNNLFPKGIGEEHAGITEKIDLTGTNKDQANFLVEKAIWNIDDQMDNIFGKDYGAIKTFITKEFSTLRKSFRREDKTRKRRCNFVGSVNKRKLFTDAQNRRYLAFEIEKIQWELAKKIDIDQVWLQAYELYRQGKEQCYFDKEDEAIINAMADEYSDVPQEEDWLIRCFEPVEESHPERKYYMAGEILAIMKQASGLNLMPFKLTNVFEKLELHPIQKRIPWQGKTQPRMVYVLRELFKRENGRILVNGEMAFEAEPKPWEQAAKVQANVFVDNDNINNIVLYEQREYKREGLLKWKHKVGTRFAEFNNKAVIEKLEALWMEQNKVNK